MVFMIEDHYDYLIVGAGLFLVPHLLIVPVNRERNVW